MNSPSPKRPSANDTMRDLLGPLPATPFQVLPPSLGPNDARAGDAGPWVDASTVAAHLSVTRSYVYEHAADLGAIRLGTGAKARVRFRLDIVERALTCTDSRGSQPAEPLAAKPRTRKRRQQSLGTNVPLLPIRPVAPRGNSAS